MNYTSTENMALMAAREIHDRDIVFCGTGISMLAAMAAKHINAPDSVIFFETGSIDSRLDEIPLAVSDPRVMHGSASNGSLLDSFSTIQNGITGSRTVGILGAAQIDKFGNLNTTVIGDYQQPAIRFAGSGGGCDVASLVPRCIIFMKHEKRKFVNRLDYLTSPGYLDGPHGREQAGLPQRRSTTVVTDLGIMGFDDDTKEMYLDRYYRGITPHDILERMEFEVDISRAVEAIPPSDDELLILRERCDPQRLFL